MSQLNFIISQQNKAYWIKSKCTTNLLLFQGRILIPSDTKLPHTAASCAGFRSINILFRRTIASQSSFSPRIAAAVSPNGNMTWLSISNALASCITLLIWHKKTNCVRNLHKKFH